MSVIRDAIHGEVEITKAELDLLDLPRMQRLRRIKQLAVTNLVYPGANHSRFEHSLGTMHLSGRLCRNLGLNKEDTAYVRTAALLHDIGHAAFSHEVEGIVKRATGQTHEEAGSALISKGEVKTSLEQNGLDAKKISKMICGHGLGSLITSGAGSDRMDYLLRDSHYTGVAYGVIDADRLIRTAVLDNERLCIKESGLEAAESLLIGRFLMFSAVYLHHTVRIASGMLYKGVDAALEDNALEPKDLMELDDHGLFVKASQSDRARKLMERIEYRNLYKRACQIPFRELGAEGRKKLSNEAYLKKLEAEIAEEAGIQHDEVVADFSQSYWGKGEEITIEYENRTEKITNASAIVKAIKETEQSRLELLVASPKASVSKVAKASSRVLSHLFG